MKFPRELFLNEPKECEELLAKHLAGLDIPEFKSFTLYGEADAPVKLDLYTRKRPEYNEPSMAVVSRGDEGLLDVVVIDPNGKRRIAEAEEQAQRVAAKVALSDAAREAIKTTTKSAAPTL